MSDIYRLRWYSIWHIICGIWYIICGTWYRIFGISYIKIGTCNHPEVDRIRAIERIPYGSFKDPVLSTPGWLYSFQGCILTKTGQQASFCIHTFGGPGKDDSESQGMFRVPTRLPASKCSSKTIKWLDDLCESDVGCILGS